MEDRNIIKALECCYTTGTSCEECPMYNFDECNDVLMAKYVRDLINRQQAEIERLSKKNEELAEILSDTIRIRYAEAKTEAIKEFAERLTDRADLVKVNDFDSKYAISQDDIDNLVKEMVGESK